MEDPEAMAPREARRKDAGSNGPEAKAGSAGRRAGSFFFSLPPEKKRGEKVGRGRRVFFWRRASWDPEEKDAGPGPGLREGREKDAERRTPERFPGRKDAGRAPGKRRGPRSPGKGPKKDAEKKRRGPKKAISGLLGHFLTPMPEISGAYPLPPTPHLNINDDLGSHKTRLFMVGG